MKMCWAYSSILGTLMTFKFELWPTVVPDGQLVGWMEKLTMIPAQLQLKLIWSWDWDEQKLHIRICGQKLWTSLNESKVFKYLQSLNNFNHWLHEYYYINKEKSFKKQKKPHYWYIHFTRLCNFWRNLSCIFLARTLSLLIITTRGLCQFWVTKDCVQLMSTEFD